MVYVWQQISSKEKEMSIMIDKVKEVKLVKYILARLKEPTSWAGIIMVLTSAGLHLSADQISLITAAGVGVVGLILYLYPQYKEEDSKDGES